MKTHTKIAIDRAVGLPFAWLFNIAAQILGKLLGRDHSITTENVRTIVIAKYVGMGSIIQATPLIRSLKASFPGARIVFLTGRSCRPLVERLEHIDLIITVDDSSVWQVARTTLRTIAMLIRARVDLFFDLEVYSAYASIMALCSLTRNRIGFYRESAEHKKGVYTHLMYFNPRSPIRYIYLQLGRTVGCIPQQPDRLGSIRVDESDRREIALKLALVGVDSGNYIVINPNASDLVIERRWPAERFATLIGHVVHSHDAAIVLVGAPAERPYVTGLFESLAEEERKRAVNLAGELSLGGLFALLEKARCVVTNDTGPMHMAWALGVPTICLFGPVDPDHYGWRGSGVEILYKHVYCSPCVHEVDIPPCGGNNICMQRIAVDEVAAAVDRAISRHLQSEVPAIEENFFVAPPGAPLGLIVRGSIAEAVRQGQGPS
jgi:ADP-heptose:LPS heptosyltransferase